MEEQKKKRIRRTAHQVWEEKIQTLEEQIEADTRRLESRKQELEKLRSSEPGIGRPRRLSNKQMTEYMAKHPAESAKAIEEANGDGEKLNAIISRLFYSQPA